MAARKQFFIDVTATFFQGERGGIPRVVRKYAETFGEHPDLDVVCFVHAGGGFFAVPANAIAKPRRLSRVVKQLRAVLGIRNYPFLPLYDVAIKFWQGLGALQLRLRALAGRAGAIPSFESGDTILLPLLPRRGSYVKCMRRTNRGAAVVALVHDLFPIQFPAYYAADVRRIFVRGFALQVEISDAIIAISRHTAANVQHYLAERNIRLPVRVVYLGSDVGEVEHAPGAVSRDAASPTFLSVGTCEPRKNYGFALALCDRLWASGRDFRYVIVGGIDTYWSQIARTIHDHPEYGSRLFHHASANDDELTRLYRSADFLLAASVDEGFGLPVMEARQFGLPVVCSDIAVFRELCPDASFFPIDDLAAATARVAQIPGWGRRSEGPSPSARRSHAYMAAEHDPDARGDRRGLVRGRRRQAVS